VDPGETIDLNVTAENTGNADAFNVSGVLSALTPGITITANTAAFPDIPVGLTGTSLTPFQFVVGLSVPCGTLIDFTLDLTYEDGGGNPFSNAVSFQVAVGQLQPPLEFLLTDFDDCADPPTSVCPPCVPVNGDWTVINGGNKVGWTHAGPGCPSVCEESLFPTNYYICDTYCPGWTTYHDEELVSPVVDTSAATTVTLRFDNDYYNYAMPTTSAVNVRSSKTANAWVTLKDFTWCDAWWCEDAVPCPCNGTFTLDATAQCAGAADCQFEFHQVTNYYDSWWWAVDNVAVEAPVAPVCNPAACCMPDVAYDAGFNPVATLAQVCGDGDLIVEPGERWQATVQLINAAACTANNVRADLTVNLGSAVAAAVCNNPGVYGNIPAGGTAQFTYSFVVDAGAVCVNDLTFDITGIVSDEGAYPGEIPAFAVQVGTINPGPTETAAQATDPLTEKNGTISSDFTSAFTIPGAAKSATLSYTLSGGTDLVNCVEVALVDPLGAATVVKPFMVADANPYDVTALYTGAGTYRLQLTEAGKGCGAGGSATLTAGTLSVTAPDVTECGVSACLCLCPALDAAVISDIAPNPACDGDTIAFTAQAATGGVPPYIYRWDFENDGIFDATAQTATNVYGGPGPYTVLLRVEDSCGVPGPQTQNTTAPVTVDALPTPTIGQSCGVPTPVDSTLDAGAGYASYLWTTTPPGGPGDGATTQTIVVPCGTVETYPRAALGRRPRRRYAHALFPHWFIAATPLPTAETQTALWTRARRSTSTSRCRTRAARTLSTRAACFPR
jgi:hypothetical protein